MTVVVLVECGAERLLIDSLKIFCVVDLLEKVGSRAVVIGDLLLLAVKSTLESLATSEVVNFLEGSILLDACDQVAVVISNVVDQQLGDGLGALELL